MKSEQEELRLLLRSRFPLLVLGTAHVVDELRSTRPLAVVRAEEVAGLRAWARPRTVPAD